jgi:3-oxoacyl-[acyl-carrier-protein] synthase-3
MPTTRTTSRARISSLATYVPPRVLTNADLEKMVETSDECITQRTGIRERHIVDPGVGTSDLALQAARCAIEKAGLTPADIDFIVVGTTTPDMLFPSTACLLQAKLGATNAWGFDLFAACSGFTYALTTAAQMVSAGGSKRALVVGADVLSKLMNFADRSTCVLFGDGAGAAVLERVESGGFLAFELGADGAGGVDLTLPAGGSRIPTTAESVARGDHYVHMNGRQVFKFATRVLVSSAENVLERAGLSIEDVDVYVPHQANVRIIDHAVARLGIREDRVVVNVDRYGNTSSASIPMALADALAEGRVHRGDTVLMTGMGAGLTWGSAVMNWTEES